MSARSLLSTARALALLTLAAATTPLAAVSTQLSQGLPFSDIDFVSTRPQISPNGQWAVYRQDAVLDGVVELWSVRLDGTGQPIRLTDPLWSSLQVVTFAISPNSARVVYKVAQNTCVVGTVPDCRIELFSIPIDGSAAPTQLNPPLGVNRNVTSFLISPTSTRVFYISDQVTDNVYQLYSVAITGGAAVRLNADLPSDWDVEAYRVSPNGLTVIYRDERAALGYGKLWSVPATGSSAAENISLALPNFGAVGSYFQISPDSSKVVYRADAISDDSYNLYTVPIGGGSSTALNTGLAAGASVESGFLIADDNSRVVYLAAPLSQAPTFQLYSVPLGGGIPETRLNGTLGAGQDVETGFALDFDGTKVVYRSDEDTNDTIELYAVPIAGGTRTRLNGELTAGGDVSVDFAISPDDTRVVYIADQSADELKELWSVAIVGGAVTKLNRTLVSGGDVQAFRISPDSDFVVYGADQDSDTVDELLSVSIAGGSVVDLNDPLVPGGDVSLTYLTAPIFAISSDSLRVLYAADGLVDDEIELFAYSQVGVPSAPTAVVATPGNTQATVTFLPPANDGGSNITGYIVTPSPATGGWSDVNAGSTNLTHLITGLTNGTTYTFTVRATNANGTGIPSLPSNGVTPATVPGAPTGVVAAAGDTQATVTFSAPLDNGGSPITGYTVTSNPAGGVDSNAGSPVLSHLVTGLTNGTAYTFTVVAGNAVGTGAPSLPSASVTPAPDACASNATTLCLRNDMFNISVTWRDFQDRTGSGQATELSNESGDFWFFNAQSNELMVKIIDACASTGNYWVFWRALSNVEMDLVIHNTTTLQTLTYHNPLGYSSNGHLDIDTIFRCDGSGPATAFFDTRTDLPAPGSPQLEEFVNPAFISPCVPEGDRTICLQGGRFLVQGFWNDFSGGSGNAHLIKTNESSGYAWFFNRNNYEMLFKLVDACSYNGNTWVSIAGLTNVSTALTIRDTWTGTVYRQKNALGVDFPTNLDIETNLDYCGQSPF